MPTYDYICQTCDKRFDYFQSMSSPLLKSNPDCEDKNCHVKRVVSGGSGLIFKGSGFYLTDYKNKKNKSNSKILFQNFFLLLDSCEIDVRLSHV